MADNFKNKIQRLELENFTCFAKAEMDFSSGINVLIGENGTGKTHVLKVLYGMLKNTKIEAQHTFSDKEGLIYSLIKTDREKHNLDRISENNVPTPFKIRFKIDNHNTILFSSSDVKGNDLDKWQKNSNGRNTHPDIETQWTKLKYLFVPTHEMLTLYPGFMYAYNNRENAFDATYYDLALALDALPLKGKALESVEPLLKDIEQTINAKIYRKDGFFYLKFNNMRLELEASLAAEGIKKLGQMLYLIMNGALTNNCILFWDEPEVNLNPRYIIVVAKFLQTLAKNGVQIFVATHDYLLAHLLSLDAEYKQETAPPSMKFFSFYKTENGTGIEAADTIAGLEHNALLDEYAAYYELEQTLFRKSMQTDALNVQFLPVI